MTTADGRVYDAEVVGTDPTYDLAVIKLQDAEGLTPIEFADSSELNVGDETIAVGAPLGLSNTVTTGIVSALNRSIQIASSAAPDSSDAEDDSEGDSPVPDDGQTPPFFFDFGEGENQAQSPTESISIAVIQTDAAINPGNSGGALVDSEGKLIGINVAIASAGGTGAEAGSIGVGFSIPSNIVQRITDEIIENGSATHGLLGASVSPRHPSKDRRSPARTSARSSTAARPRPPAFRRAISSPPSTESRSQTPPTSPRRFARPRPAATPPSPSSATARRRRST